MNAYITEEGILNWEACLNIIDPPPPKFNRVFSRCHRPGLDPRFIILHYTAGGGVQGTIDWLMRDEAKESYHFIIDRNGDIVQMVSCEAQAWHSGRSEWKSLKEMNGYSIGIALCNWGPIRKDERDGKYYPRVLEDCRCELDAARVTRGDCRLPESTFQRWEIYPQRQMYSLCVLIHALCRYFEIEDVLGHSDVAPGRKIDPGPALDIQLLRDFARIARRL